MLRDRTFGGVQSPCFNVEIEGKADGQFEAILRGAGSSKFVPVRVAGPTPDAALRGLSERVLRNGRGHEHERRPAMEAIRAARESLRSINTETRNA